MDRQQQIEQLIAKIPEMTAAIGRAVRRAVWQHKQLGHPICTLRDGEVVWIPPEEIQVEKPQDD